MLVGAIREEGLKRSQAMAFETELADGIGARLMGSPNMQRAYRWAIASMTQLDLADPHLENIGVPMISWKQNNAWARISSPDAMVLIAQAGAWSVSTHGAVTAEVAAVELNNDDDLARERGKLRDKIVLLGPLRPTPPIDQPLWVHYSDDAVLSGVVNKPVRASYAGQAERLPKQIQSGLFRARLRAFLKAEGVRAVIVASRESDHGGGSGALAIDEGPFSVRSWSPAERPAFPFAFVSIEGFGRAWRLAKAGRKVEIQLDIDTSDEDTLAPGYNVVADFRGTDPALKEQVVLAGAHLDSWGSGEGALDNGSGVAEVLEAVRILKAIGFKPRRTLRVVLFGGEEEGLLGSAAYARQHLGFYPRSATPEQMALPVESRRAKTGPLQTLPDYGKFSIAYNMDAGSGRIRAAYAGGNPALAAMFRQWIEPLKDLGVLTVYDEPFYPADQSTFSEIGLPGVMFLHDPLEYFTRARHSNLDTIERVAPDELAQSATVLAVFLAASASADRLMPRQ